MEKIKPRQTKSSISIIDACNDPKLFQSWIGDDASWYPWKVFMKTVFGIPLTPKDQELYYQCTKRKKSPKHQFKEAWVVVGRRGGKSFTLALIAVYLACFKDWAPYLTAGEHGRIVIIAQDRKQAKVIFKYLEALIEQTPLLKSLKTHSTMEYFEIRGNIMIEVHAASFRGIRGYTIVAALLDEVAFWRSEDSLNPDHEILTAIKPGMATIPGAMLLCASSPYSRRGILYDAWKKYFKQDNDSVLVWQAPTKVMHPSISQEFLDDEYERDPVSAKAEYGAEFRADIDNLVSEEVLADCVVFDRHELPPLDDLDYVAFTDPSGGSSDSFTLAIAHRENEIYVLDLFRERIPPFSPAEVVVDFCEVLRAYHVTRVYGDRYGGEWPRERFREHDVYYEVSSRTKSEIYRDFLPILNARHAELLDDKKLINQLLGLERRASRGGREIIDHMPGIHDDIANAVAGALVNLKFAAIDMW